MKSINRVFLVGRLGSKPESKTTRNGKVYAKFSVATSRWRHSDSGHIEETDWHRVTAWGQMGQICLDRLDKGSPVFVEGELCHYKVEEEGKTRHGTSITAQNVSFLALPLQSASAS